MQYIHPSTQCAKVSISIIVKLSTWQANKERRIRFVTWMVIDILLCVFLHSSISLYASTTTFAGTWRTSNPPSEYWYSTLWGLHLHSHCKSISSTSYCGAFLLYTVSTVLVKAVWRLQSTQRWSTPFDTKKAMRRSQKLLKKASQSWVYIIFYHMFNHNPITINLCVLQQEFLNVQVCHYHRKDTVSSNYYAFHSMPISCFSNR